MLGTRDPGKEHKAVELFVHARGEVVSEEATSNDSEYSGIRRGRPSRPCNQGLVLKNERSEKLRATEE